MIESDWLSCTDPQDMLTYLRGRTNARKLRLFACACSRRIWHLLSDERSRNAIEIAERYADGLASESELTAAEAAAWDVTNRFMDTLLETPRSARRKIRLAVEASKAAAEAAVCRPRPESNWQVGDISAQTSAGRTWAAAWVCCNVVRAVVRRTMADQPRDSAEAGEKAQQADLLREIMGNPWRPLAASKIWAPEVPILAAALYRGKNGHTALCCALEASGQAELARHFREPGHPKGCWALDLILAKGASDQDLPV